MMQFFNNRDFLLIFREVFQNDQIKKKSSYTHITLADHGLDHFL